MGLLKHILPEVDSLSECEQGPPYHMEGNVFVHTCMIADNLPDNASNELRWAAILHDIGKPATRHEDNHCNVSFISHDKIGADLADSICRRLKFSNKKRKKITWLIKNHQRIFRFAEMKPAKAKRFALNEDLTDIHPYFEDLLKLAQADQDSAIPIDSKALYGNRCMKTILDRLGDIKSDLRTKKETNCNPGELINGHDVMQVLGVEKGGPEVGRILKWVKDRLLEEPHPSRERALAFLDQFGLQARPS